MTDKIIRTNFIRNIIDKDIENNKNNGEVITRFPPEPNGYLHIGHAKAIFLNFQIANDYKGKCNLRFDDTNPSNEEEIFAKSIKTDVEWLGYNSSENIHYASDYFDDLYNLAISLIKKGLAYVCDLSADEVRQYRGTLKEKGTNSPYRERSISENIDLFDRMKNGEFIDGEKTLRAKIDMQSGNMNMRDPAMYRIKHVFHPRTQNKWCIYPMYDYTHPISDALEKITHSLCTLEFQDHRPLYDWFIENCDFMRRPQQIESSRLNLTYTVTSKRKLKYLVENNLVNGWDDPRMPTIKGMRKRGYTPQSIKNFIDALGASKQDSIIDFKILEEEVRNDLNVSAERRHAVLNPLEVHIENLDSQLISSPNHPQNPDFGRRDISISSRIYIEEDDFVIDLKKGQKKLSLNGRIRLMNAYVIECYEIEKNADGKIVLVKCRFLEETLGGKKPFDGKKADGIIHWVDANNAINAEVRVYDRLFNCENTNNCENIESIINPNSLTIIKNAKIETSCRDTENGVRFQFNRIGYFIADYDDHKSSSPVFNSIVTLRDTWNVK